MFNKINDANLNLITWLKEFPKLYFSEIAQNSYSDKIQFSTAKKNGTHILLQLLIILKMQNKCFIMFNNQLSNFVSAGM